MGLRYLVFTRPDVAFSVGIISRFMERPALMQAKRILRYVNGTLDFALIYTKDDGSYLLSGYSDSDLAGNVEDRKSTRGMAFYSLGSLRSKNVWPCHLVNLSLWQPQPRRAKQSGCIIF